jgi:LysM repeat protein
MPTTPRPAGQQILTAIGHLIWTSIVVVGAPVALWRFFGWPLPAEMPDWGEVVSTPLQLVDPVVILNIFVCLAWICWATLMAYVALDVIDTARGVGQRIHRIGPFGTVAAKLVGSAVLLASLARPTVSLAAPAAPTPVVHVVDATAFATNPALSLPADGPLTSAAPIVNTTTTPTPVPAGNPVYVVQRGDSLWAIAEAHLGSGFRWTEIHDLNRSFIADPDIICIGWQLKLPADANLPALDAPAPEPVASPTPEPIPPAPAPAAETPAPEPPAQPTESHAPPTSTAQGEAGRKVDVAPAEAADPMDAAPDVPVAEDELPSLAVLVPGITGATVLASSLLLLRRSQRRHDRSVPRSPRTVVPLERSLVAAADVPLVRWAGQELALLGEQLAGHRIEANPVAVEFSADSGLELLWDRPFPNAPAPWEAVPGAWAWRLLYDPDAPVPSADRPALIAGLVTVGERNGRQLMLDLEGLGSLGITGDPHAIDRFLRSIVVELGTGDELADATVVLTPDAIDLAVVDHLPRVRVDEELTARQRVAALASDLERKLDEIGCSSTFAYRLFDSPVLPVEVAVMLTGAPAAASDLTSIARPRRGVAVIANGELPGSESHLHIEADGSARLEPLGLSFLAVGVDAGTTSALAQLLDDVAEAPAELDVAPSPPPTAPEPEHLEVEVCQDEFDPAINLPSRDHGLPAEELDLREPVVLAEPVPLDDDWEPTQPRLLVRLLGEPTIVDGPAMGRREMIVVAVMACLGRPVRQEDLQEAVWGGEAVVPRTIWNMVGRTRKQLGEWDGEPILATADRRQNTYQLADGVTTDIALLRETHDRARNVSSSEAAGLLRTGLALVHGPPFAADGYEWARVNQYSHDAERLIEDTATWLVELSLLAGDLDTARYAVMQGLRGLPGNEVLYRARMRIENAAGNATAVRTAYRELTDYLDDLESTPSPDTAELFESLTSARQSVTMASGE